MARKRSVLLAALLLSCLTLSGFDDKFVRQVYHSPNPIARNIKCNGELVYVYNDWYLYVYSLANIWNPVIETGFLSTYPITDVETLAQNQLFICSHEPANYITELDSLNTFGRIYTVQRLTCTKVKREGTLLYASHRDNGLEIYDISKSVYPQLLAGFSENWGVIDLEARYPEVHALNDFGYVNIDVTDITHPRTVGSNYEIVDGKILSVNRNIAWVGAGSTLLAVEVTYPDKPVIINRYRFSADINAIEARGNELFIALTTSGLKIMDIANPRKISEKNQFYHKSGITSIALEGDYIYLGADTKGWFVLEYR